MTVLPFHRSDKRRSVAIVGSGISGASAAWALRNTADVTLFEGDRRVGGHTATVDIDYDGTPIAVDTGFIVYNELNYPELTALFHELDIATHASDMGFSLSLDGGKLEWCGSTLRTIFAQKRNFFSPGFIWMLREVLRFNRLCVADRDSGQMGDATIGKYLDARRFSASFRENYLIPMAAAIWSTPRAQMLEYPAQAFVTFLENHRLIHSDRPVWRTVTGGSKNYLARLLEPLRGHVHLGAPVRSIVRDALGVTIHRDGVEPQRFDDVIIACHSDQALKLLGDPSADETKILSAIGYRPNRVVLHRDPGLMPKRKLAWTAWNYLRSSHESANDNICVTYWMNLLQGIDKRYPLFVSLNPIHEPRADLVFGEWSYEHPQFDTKALEAQGRLADIQGHRNTWFAGAWTGHGFHEDGLRSGLDAACALGATVPWRAVPQMAEIEPALARAAE